MTIEFTKDQYKTLLRLMYCGEWMLNSYKINKDKIYKETGEFEQYIFSFAKEFKLDKWIEYDDEDGMYYPSASMEDTFHAFVDKYNKRQKEL